MGAFNTGQLIDNLLRCAFLLEAGQVSTRLNTRFKFNFNLVITLEARKQRALVLPIGILDENAPLSICEKASRFSGLNYAAACTRLRLTLRVTG